ncbi:MAG: hypothetical protein OEZ10_10195 [Gammaproteobacteria bacterium]|nr:hypothetical protein [Gammaproteobacteria bacterium]
MSKKFRHWQLVSLFSVLVASALPTQAADSYTLFESGQVRPLTMSENGKLLFAANTPDSRVEIYRIAGSGLRHCGSVTTGLEPVALALRNDRELWVVNHLSDSVSVVEINAAACDNGKHDNNTPVARVVRTLLVGDEPRDIVFAGPDRSRAFITTAHRGQNNKRDPQLTTPGVGRADVWVFDANGGDDELTVITLFTDTPRALAVSADGKKVYAAGFYTGNQTTTVPMSVVAYNGGLPAPLTNFTGELQPPTGLIVQYTGDQWLDEMGRSWNDFVKFTLPDRDVFEIDAMANPPAPVAGGSWSGVGTVLFNMAVNPQNGAIYVSNTQANNHIRFEGPGIFANSTNRGQIAKSHITVLKGNDVIPRHINKHINYDQCCDMIPNEENNRSLAFPVDMTVSSDGRTLYVAAYGSAKVGIFDTRALENDSFVPDDGNHVELSGGGPAGVVLDEQRNRLYVLTRFNNSVSVVDLKKRRELTSVAMYNPEPEHIVKGRRFLYDARFTSSHGDSACASCHIFGDMDSLAWDLGNPDATTMLNPSPLVVHPDDVGMNHISIHFRPMKGPMTTQSFRGMANHGSMHWRGDRNGGFLEPNQQPDSGVYNEAEAFRQFNPAFFGLVGRFAPLSPEDMQAFTDFALEIMYPPNPIRNLDNSLTADQQAGHDFFFGGLSDPFAACNGCHVVDPDGNAEFGVDKPGFYGADGRATFELGPQIMKVPHLRNLYQKVGMFGMARSPDGFILSESEDPAVPNAHTGEQVRGFGFFHDGSIDTVFRFLRTIAFQHSDGGPFPNPGGFDIGPAGDDQRRQVEQFVMAFPSNLAPVVGQQVTIAGGNVAGLSRLQLLTARADVGECDLIAKRQRGNREQGYLYTGNASFRTDRSNEDSVHLVRLVMSAGKNNPVTFTCTPPGSGVRMGIDRNEDGVLDGDRRHRH